MKDFGLETTIPIYTGATITTAHRLRLFQHLGPYAQAPKGSGPELHHHHQFVPQTQEDVRLQSTTLPLFTHKGYSRSNHATDKACLLCKRSSRSS